MLLRLYIILLITNYDVKNSFKMYTASQFFKSISIKGKLPMAYCGCFLTQIL